MRASLTCNIGEGQFLITPRRPDALGANATLQYTVIGSTTLAASYTVFASSYLQRVHPTQSLSRPAIFIRSSAKLGLWAGALGAAVNWYYYKAFIGVTASYTNLSIIPRKLYACTPSITADDGALAGAALGLVASVPTLFSRRPTIPQWTRCLGMMNIGACVGTAGTHGYLQYTGERQKAYKQLEHRTKQKTFELSHIFLDKELMARFDPLVQQYVRHSVVWHASCLPVDATNEFTEGVSTPMVAHDTGASMQTQQPEKIASHPPLPDYAQDLAKTSTPSTLARIAALETEKKALTDEAEYLLSFTAQKQYKHYHSKDTPEDERRQRLQEIDILQFFYDRLRFAAYAIDVELAKARLFVQHKTITEAHPASDDVLESWLPRTQSIDYKSHDPAMSLGEMEKLQSEVAADVRAFESSMAMSGGDKDYYERCRMGLAEGRVVLGAVDGVVWELERAREGVEKTRNAQAASIPLATVRKPDQVETGKIEDKTEVVGAEATGREKKF
jgi:hypothetical protein